MEFLGIGPLELFFIVLIALIVLGPKDMAKAGRTLGKFMRRTILSPTWLGLQKRIRNLPYEMMREAGLEENDLKMLADLDSTTPGSQQKRVRPSDFTEASSAALTSAPSEWTTPPTVDVPNDWTTSRQILPPQTPTTEAGEKPE